VPHKVCCAQKKVVFELKTKAKYFSPKMYFVSKTLKPACRPGSTHIKKRCGPSSDKTTATIIRKYLQMQGRIIRVMAGKGM